LTTFADDARGFEDEDPQPSHRALSSRAGATLSFRDKTHLVKGTVLPDKIGPRMVPLEVGKFLN
jgi:hypothetical protein